MVQLLGLCRFSYPSKVGAFNHDHGDLAALQGFLYDPDRLARRFYFLEHLVVPSVAGQTDSDFTLVILAGDQMPKASQDRLLAVTEPFSQIKVVFAPEGQVHRDICKQVLMDHRSDGDPIVGEFRLDDDDAVARDFIARVRAHFDVVIKLFREQKRLCLDYTRGHIMLFGSDAVSVREIVERNYTPAQVIFRHRSADESLLDANHTQLWRRMTTIHWPNRPMFIRGAHGDNDSALRSRIKSITDWLPLDGGGGPLVQDRFDVDPQAISRGWARLSASG